MAYRTFLDAGVHAAAGSDFSPGPFAPLMGMQGMVTRKGWDGKIWGANQKITVAEAIKVNTLHGAYASKEEALKAVEPVREPATRSLIQAKPCNLCIVAMSLNVV